MSSLFFVEVKKDVKLKFSPFFKTSPQTFAKGRCWLLIAQSMNGSLAIGCSHSENQEVLQGNAIARGI